MTLAAAVALVAVVALVVVGVDRRDVATIVVALILEDCIMVGNLIVIGLLCAAVAYVWLRGRAAGRADEKVRSDGLAVEAQKRQAEQAKAEERAEVDAAVARRDAEKKRPGVDRANERLSRLRSQ